MKTDIKELWVNALIDGRYAQGQGLLRSLDNKFCCLGVLCDLYMTATGRGAWRKAPNVSAYAFYEDDINAPAAVAVIAPPKSVFTWATGAMPSLPVGDLIRMNDDQRKSFAEIAAFIQEHK